MHRRHDAARRDNVGACLKNCTIHRAIRGRNSSCSCKWSHCASFGLLKAKNIDPTEAAATLSRMALLRSRKEKIKDKECITMTTRAKERKMFIPASRNKEYGIAIPRRTSEYPRVCWTG